MYSENLSEAVAVFVRAHARDFFEDTGKVSGVRSAFPAELFRDGGERLPNLVELGGLEEEAGDAKAARLLRVAEVPVACQYDDLQLRKLRAQSGQHGQPVVSGHADIGKEDMRLLLADEPCAGDDIL